MSGQTMPQKANRVQLPLIRSHTGAPRPGQTKPDMPSQRQARGRGSHISSLWVPREKESLSTHLKETLLPQETQLWGRLRCHGYQTEGAYLLSVSA